MVLDTFRRINDSIMTGFKQVDINNRAVHELTKMENYERIEDLIELLKDYSSEDKIFILRAFTFADKAHEGQFRKSGSPYIVHPIAVACILAQLHADKETIAAGLLHDVVEDCENYDLDLIYQQFGETVAELVEGVTKIRKNEVEDPEERRDANLKKIIDSITQDIRIFLIKLADRLHNMRTMDYQTEKKQIIKARETLEVYVHISYLLGEYRIKNELEDLAFKYAMPEQYIKMEEVRQGIKEQKRKTLDKIVVMTELELANHNIEHQFELKAKHLYGIYRRIKKRNGNLDDLDVEELINIANSIHDIIALKVITPEKDDCYKTCDIVSKMYKVIESKNKDYIIKPKTNRYMGLHRSVEEDGTLVQLQFKTPEMYKINQNGITEYWEHKKDQTDLGTMQDIVRQMQFYQFLERVKKDDLPFKEYSDEIRRDLLSKMIYVENEQGKVIELPEQSTIIDYAFRTNPECAPYITGATVNGEPINLGYVLDNKNIVELEYGDNYMNLSRAIDCCNTHYAKRKINSLMH